MIIDGMLMKDTISADPQAPSLVVFGKTAGRMDEVIRLFRDMGGVSAYGTFTEEEALQRIARCRDWEPCSSAVPSRRHRAAASATSSSTRGSRLEM